MKVWCSVDDGGDIEMIWPEKPEKKADAYGGWGKENCIHLSCPEGGIGDLLFPKGVKKGQCVKCTLKRLEVDDG